MTIYSDLLKIFRTYLFYDLKLKNSKVNNYSITSRFRILQRYFSTIDFNRQNFIRFLQELRNKGHKDSYLNSFIKTAKQLDRFLKLNELSDFTYFRVRFEPKQTLTPAQIRAIINCPRFYTNRTSTKNAQISLKFKALFTLMAHTGCRVGEALQLRKVDTHPTYVIFKDTKTNEDRQVPISDETYILLTSLSEPGERVFNIAFCSSVNEELKKRAQILSLPHISAHTFRYSFITTMCPIIGEDSVMRIVGHKDPATTARYNQKKFEQLRGDILKHPNYRNSLSMDFIATTLTKSVDFLLGSERFNLEVVRKAHQFRLVVSDNSRNSDLDICIPA